MNQVAERMDALESNLDATLAATATTTTLLPISPTTTAPAGPTTSTTAPVALGLDPASEQRLRSIIVGGRWDFALPVPSAGIDTARWTPSDDGGTLSSLVPAPPQATLTFFLDFLKRRKFVHRLLRSDNSGASIIDLGGHGTITITPSGNRSSLSITVHL